MASSLLTIKYKFSLLNFVQWNGVWVFFVVDVDVVPPFAGEVVEAGLVHGVLEGF